MRRGSKSLAPMGRALVLALLLTGCAVVPLVATEGEAAPEADAKSGEQLQEAIKEASDAQNYLQEADEKVVSKEVKQAPAAELANADGDVATTGNCKADIIEFCPDIHPGEGRLADCLSQQRAEEEKEGYSGKKVAEVCVKELDEFKIDRSTNINKNVPLAKACKEDADKFCKDVNTKEPGAVIACLRERRTELTDKCQKELLEEMVEGADDFRKDALLFDACKDDAAAVCPKVEPKDGAVQDCLRKHRNQISWECQDELFRQDQENADDLRLSVRMFKKCFEDKKRFCADVAPGNARAKECLEDHRLDDGFSEGCRQEIEGMIEQRVGDFRLDTVMREYCEEDIEYLCAFQRESLEAGTELDARVVLCLQDYRDEITNPNCQKRVHKYIELASQDVRFNVPLAEACYDDRIAFCSNVPPGSARVIRCMQNMREKLSFDCKAALFDQEVLMSENIDFNYPMKAACTKEIDEFCKDVPHGHSRVIRCLADNKDKESFGQKCRKEVESFEERASTDYRLNWNLERACEDTVPQLCGDLCDPMQVNPCGGKVLRCLVEKYEDITNQECRSEVFYFIKMEVQDFRNDVILAENCRADVDKFCKDVQPGEGRVHQCLQEHRDELAPNCRSEEIKLMVRQASNVELVPSISKFCREEMNAFCKGVRPGKARMFNCLLVNAPQADFSNQCRQVLTRQVHRRTRDWRLDYGLYSRCGGDVPRLCADEARDADRGSGVVIKCLMTKVEQVSEGCARELARTVSTALQFYESNNPVTQLCDADVESVCLKDKDKSSIPLGMVRDCLTRSVFVTHNPEEDAPSAEPTPEATPAAEEVAPAEEQPQEAAPAQEQPQEAAPAEEQPQEAAPAEEQPAEPAPEAEAKPEQPAEGEQNEGGTRKLLAWIATEGRRRLQSVSNQIGAVGSMPRAPTLQEACANTVLISVMGERAYGSFEAGLASSYLAGQLSALSDGQLGMVPEESGFVLTGWWALMGMLALATILLGGGFLVYSKYYKPQREYTAVIKNASV